MSIGILTILAATAALPVAIAIARPIARFVEAL